jgi:TPR repeat protein
MKRKDVASARLFYIAAFDQGALTAATLVGTTYDPIELKQLGVVGLRGDVEQALHWYGIGRDAGDPDAARRIAILQGQ